jgi:hypothetical protein
MKIALLVAALLLMAPALRAQDNLSTTRFEAQHKITPHMAEHLPQTEATIIGILKTGSPSAQAQAVQTIRDLEQMFPKYRFTDLLDPLAKKLKDDHADMAVRDLSALALDELHSDAGDAVIREVARSSGDDGLKTLCKALQFGSTLEASGH